VEGSVVRSEEQARIAIAMLAESKEVSRRGMLALTRLDNERSEQLGTECSSFNLPDIEDLLGGTDQTSNCCMIPICSQALVKQRPLNIPVGALTTRGPLARFDPSKAWSATALQAKSFPSSSVGRAGDC
jgi:hypothetical protein